MNRNLHNSRGSSTHDRNQNPRWRTVFIALMLVLAIGSASLTPSAQAAPAAEQGTYRMSSAIISDDGEVCIGDMVHIRVFVYLQTGEIGQDIQYLPGIRVDGEISGELAGSTRINPLSGRNYTSSSSDRPGMANYFLQPTKAGKLTITFDATITDGWFGLGGTYPLRTRERITVVECQYRVSGVSDFTVPGAFVGAVFKDAVMRLGSDGLYTGTATVQWTGYNLTTLCISGHYLDPATTKVELTGLIDDKGRLNLAIVYEPGETKWRATCYAEFVDKQKLDPWELKFAVPVSGDVGKLLYHGIDFAYGKTTITVIQEKTGGQ